MHTAVVEFDALPDPVRTGSENQHLRPVGLRSHLRLCRRVEFVAGVVIRGLRLELGRAGIDGLEHRMNVEALPQRPHTGLAGEFRPQRGDLAVRQSAVLGPPQQFPIEHGRLEQFRTQAHQAIDLFNKPGINSRGLGDLLDSGAHPQRQFDVVQAPLGGGSQSGQYVLYPPLFIRCGPKTGASGLQRAHHLAERLDEVASQRHRLTHRLHRGGQCRVCSGELFEGEPRRLDDDVVESRFEAGRGLFGDVVEDLIKGVPDGQLGGDLRDRETGGLRGQRR